MLKEFTQCMKSLGGQDPGLLTNQLEQHSHEQYSPNSAWKLFGGVLEDTSLLLLLLLTPIMFIFKSWKFHHSDSTRTRHLCLTLYALQSIQSPESHCHLMLLSPVSISCPEASILLVEARSYVYFLVVKEPRNFSFGLQPLLQLTSFLEEKPKGDWIGKSVN